VIDKGSKCKEKKSASHLIKLALMGTLVFLLQRLGVCLAIATEMIMMLLDI